MKITVQIVIDAQDGTPPAVGQVAAIARDDLTMATAGLTLAEAHEVLSGIQHHLVTAQAGAAAVTGRHCGSCGRAQPRKDTRPIVLRTLFGTLRLVSPRFKSCPCTGTGPATFSPVAALLPERTTPELLLWEARYAALTSYGAAATLLSEAFPLGRTLQSTAVRQQVERTATRLEDELGEERFSFIDTCPADWEEMPRPGLPLIAAQPASNDALARPVSVPEPRAARSGASQRGCRRCRTASWWRRIKISAVRHASSRRDSRSDVVIRVMRRKANRRHMTGDRDGQAAGKANPAGQSRGRDSRHAQARTC